MMKPTRATRDTVTAVCTLFLCLLMTLPGCATHAELRKLRQDQREVRGQFADTQVAVEALRRRIDVLKTELDDARRRTSGGGGSGSAELERRVAELEARMAMLGQAGVLSEGAVPEAGAAPAPSLGPLSTGDALAREEAALRGRRIDEGYRQAFSLARGGEYGKAVPRFREFLRRNQGSDLADDAQYWIGECYYALGDYNRAILEFNEVLLKYPQSNRVPGALLRQAFAFSDLGDDVDARLILEKLIGDYPRSDEAQHARRKLQALGG